MFLVSRSGLAAIRALRSERQSGEGRKKMKKNNPETLLHDSSITNLIPSEDSVYRKPFEEAWTLLKTIEMIDLNLYSMRQAARQLIGDLSRIENNNNTRN